MRQFTFNLTEEEWDRLMALATARGKPAEDCLRDFIRACQPGGGGWVHPAAVVPKEKL